MAPERFNSFQPESQPSHSEAELDAQEKLDEAIFAFEDRLRSALDSIEFSGEDRYSWGQYINFSEKALLKDLPQTVREKPIFSRQTITLALATREALAANPADRALIIKTFQTGKTRFFGDRALIALDAYTDLAEIIAKKESYIEAAKTAGFHDWHDAIDFDNEKLPQPDGLFKFTHLVNTAVNRYVEKGLQVPVGTDGKLDVEELMNRAYQEGLIPENNYTKFEVEMAPYFSSERNKKKTTP